MSGNPEVVSFEPWVDRELWLEVASTSQAATFFHTPYWAEIAMAADPALQDATFSARLSDGSTAVYPLVRRRSAVLPLVGEVFSTFAGCYGGPIAARPLEPGELEGLHRAALKRRVGEAGITLGPLSRPDGIPASLDVRTDTTQVLDLTVGLEQLLRGFSKGHRSAYRRAQRERVAMREGSADRDCRTYVELYRRALERWGDSATVRYPEAMFVRAFELARRLPEVVKFWFAVHRGDVVAGSLHFYWRRHVVCWHVANPQPAQPISYATALWAHAIEDAVGRGFELFDFNPSGGLTGVAAFKHHFGSEEREVLRARYSNPVYRAARRAYAPVCRGLDAVGSHRRPPTTPA